MSLVRICKAQPISSADSVPSHAILINETLPDLPSESGMLDKARARFEDQAELLVQTLWSCLPQGTLDRVMLAFQRRATSLYYGITQIPLDSQLLDWLERKRQTVEVTYDEVEKWKIVDILDNEFRGETLREALSEGLSHDEKIKAATQSEADEQDNLQFEVVGPDNVVLFTGPLNHPDVLVALRTPGYSLRGVYGSHT